jgi:hypothetical protein
VGAETLGRAETLGCYTLSKKFFELIIVKKKKKKRHDFLYGKI